jgi:hypothetical protein
MPIQIDEPYLFEVQGRVQSDRYVESEYTNPYQTLDEVLEHIKAQIQHCSEFGYTPTFNIRIEGSAEITLFPPEPRQ